MGTRLVAENIFIEAKDITLDKDQKTTIFRNNVTVQTEDKKIKSQFAEYNKVAQEIILKKDIIATDKFGNIVKTDYAEYNESKNVLKTIGLTNLTTSQNYSLEGSDIFFDNKNKVIRSDKSSIVKDLSGNKIYFENFEYLIKENIFKSVG